MKTRKKCLFTFAAHETDGDAVNELVFELGRGGLQRHNVSPVAIVECKDRRVAYLDIPRRKQRCRVRHRGMERKHCEIFSRSDSE